MVSNSKGRWINTARMSPDTIVKRIQAMLDGVAVRPAPLPPFVALQFVMPSYEQYHKVLDGGWRREPLRIVVRYKGGPISLINGGRSRRIGSKELAEGYGEVRVKGEAANDSF